MKIISDIEDYYDEFIKKELYPSVTYKRKTSSIISTGLLLEQKAASPSVIKKAMLEEISFLNQLSEVIETPRYTISTVFLGVPGQLFVAYRVNCNVKGQHHLPEYFTVKEPLEEYLRDKLDDSGISTPERLWSKQRELASKSFVGIHMVAEATLFLIFKDERTKRFQIQKDPLLKNFGLDQKVNPSSILTAIGEWLQEDALANNIKT